MSGRWEYKTVRAIFCKRMTDALKDELGQLVVSFEEGWYPLDEERSDLENADLHVIADALAPSLLENHPRHRPGQQIRLRRLDEILNQYGRKGWEFVDWVDLRPRFHGEAQADAWPIMQRENGILFRRWVPRESGHRP